MSITRYRAWRFDPEEGIGLSLGKPEMVEANASIRQAIFLLLSTVPGERVMRSEYGCELNRLLFLPNDYTTAGLAIHYVKRAIQRWEPRVEILKLDAAQNEDNSHLLNIMLQYRVRATLEKEEITFPLSLVGE